MIVWSIENMLRDNATGFVLSVDWKAEFVDGDKRVTKTDVCNFIFDGVVPISYDDLTEETVLSWVFNNVDKSGIEAELTELGAKIPASGLPWV